MDDIVTVEEKIVGTGKKESGWYWYQFTI